ncbi:MAG: BspA family leucine-rich repeat surface protein [Saprospiraceae bacterium]
MKKKYNFNPVKTIFLIVAFQCVIFNLSFAQPFITTWNTSNVGINDKSIKIRTHPNETYNYDVDWDNDGIFDQFGITGDMTHTYNSPGIYTIAIQGDFPRIFFDGSWGSMYKIISVEQWGNIVWTSMESAFEGCNNLQINAADSPNLSMVTDMSQMFYNASHFNSDSSINNWNVSNVTNMSQMFAQAYRFNQDIGSWNVGNLINMSKMFYLADSFNCYIGGWNVSNVTNMEGTFWGTESFNQKIDNWDVSSVTNMSEMFSYTKSFNQGIGNWNVGNVTNMHRMFRGAGSFNQDIGNWDISNVTDMNTMFWAAFDFNQNIGNWNIANVTDMHGMLDYSGFKIVNYDSTLIGWESQGGINKNLGAKDLRYCHADSVRSRLISTYGWSISGDNYNCFNVNSENKLQFNAFEIYPNPTQGQLNIDIEFDKPLNDIWIEIVNVQGQVFKRLHFDENQTRIQEQLDLTGLMNGNYYLVLHHHQNTTVKMITLN